MRDSLIPQMVEVLGRNHSRQVAEAGLFEIGRVFLKGADGAIREEQRVCVGLMGKVGRGVLDRRSRLRAEESFAWLRGITEALLAAQKAADVQFVSSGSPVFEDGMCVELRIDGAAAGQLGVVRKSIGAQWRMTEPVAVAELAVDALIAHLSDAPHVSPIPVYPSVARDMAIIVDEAVSHAEITEVMRKNAPVELTAIELFDIFRGEGIEEGKKSMAYSLVFRSGERTLTDEEVNGFRDRIGDGLTSELGIEIRVG
jgi:phenylalanyl-tRNA synthetase beta chain